MDDKVKNLFSIVAILIILYGILANNFGLWPFNQNGMLDYEKHKFGEGGACIQVITPAKNPDTGEVIEFPDPCQVPEGWQILHPERLPGSDINN